MQISEPQFCHPYNRYTKLGMGLLRRFDDIMLGKCLPNKELYNFLSVELGSRF